MKLRHFFRPLQKWAHFLLHLFFYRLDLNSPLVVTDGVEELHGLHHPVHLLVLGQDEVVSGQRDAEDDRRHAFEAVDPLLALGPEGKYQA